METVQQNVTCRLCSEPYIDPRTLPCLHSFCRQCLDREAKDTGPEKVVVCPACQGHASLSVGGASRLPKNLHLTYEVKMAGMAQGSCDKCAFSPPASAFCFRCHQFVCGECHAQHPGNHSTVLLDQQRARQLLAVMRPVVNCCPLLEHSDKVLSLYCEACNSMICRECAAKGEHRDHRHADIRDVAREHRDGIRRALQHAQEVVAKLGGAMDCADQAIRLTESSKESDVTKVNKVFDELSCKLEARKQSLLAELEGAVLRRAATLEYRKTRIQKMQQDLLRYCEVMFETLQTHSDQEVVSMENLLPTALSDTLRAFKDVALDSSNQDSVSVLMEVDELACDLASVGQVKETSAYPPASTWTSKSVPKVNRPYHITVSAMTSARERYRHGGMHLQVDLTSKLHDGMVVSGHAKDSGDGTYTITLTPQCEGPHSLSITMDGQHVKNSPFDVDVQRPHTPDYSTLHAPRELANVKAPWCLAVHKNGDIFVGSKTNSIHVFDRNGRLKRTIGSSGHGDGQFNAPRDIAISGDVLYVADFLNHRVQKLTAEGEFLQKFGECGSSNGQFNGPFGLAIDSSDMIYVSDSNNDRIQAFNRDCSWLMTISGRGPGNTEFHLPRGIARDVQGNIYVAAYGSASIMVFTPGGSFLRKYGNLKRPSRITVDGDGHSFVSEGGSDHLAVFDPKGRRVHTVKDLSTPGGVAIDTKASCLYVANKGANNVLKYSLQGKV